MESERRERPVEEKENTDISKENKHSQTRPKIELGMYFHLNHKEQ